MTEGIVSSIENTSEYSTTYIAQHDAECREELPEHDQSASDIGRSAFRGVYRDGGTLRSKAYTQQKSEADHHSPIGREGLCQTRTDGEYAGKEDRAAST